MEVFSKSLAHKKTVNSLCNRDPIANTFLRSTLMWYSFLFVETDDAGGS